MTLPVYSPLDGTVRLEMLPAEPNKHMFLRPWGGGGLALKNASTGVWEMYGVTFDNRINGAFTIDINNCTIDGVSGQAMQISSSVIYDKIKNGFSSIGIGNGTTGNPETVLNNIPFPGQSNGCRSRFRKNAADQSLFGGPSAEKLYLEFRSTGTLAQGDVPAVGVMADLGTPTNFNNIWNTGGFASLYYWNGQVVLGGTGVLQGDSFIGSADGNIIRMAMDFSAIFPKFWWSVNGQAWNYNGNASPETGAGAFAFPNLIGLPFTPVVLFAPNVPRGTQITPNLGPDFVYPVPAGYTGWTAPVGNVYNVYAVGNGSGAISFDLSLTPAGFDAGTGFLVKIGDGTRRLVGRCGLLPKTALVYSGGFVMGDGQDQIIGMPRNAMVTSLFNPQQIQLGWRQGSVQISAAQQAQIIRMSQSEQQKLHFVGWDGTLVSGRRAEFEVQFASNQSGPSPTAITAFVVKESGSTFPGPTLDLTAGGTFPYFINSSTGGPQSGIILGSAAYPDNFLDGVANQVHTIEFGMLPAYSAAVDVISTDYFLNARVYI